MSKYFSLQPKITKFARGKDDKILDQKIFASHLLGVSITLMGLRKKRASGPRPNVLKNIIPRSKPNSETPEYKGPSTAHSPRPF